jgi:hypothetical protein
MVEKKTVLGVLILLGIGGVAVWALKKRGEKAAIDGRSQ